MNGIQAYILSKRYTEETAAEFGAVKGAPAQVQKIVHQNGKSVVTFQWENSKGETQTSEMTVSDGTPIYDWQSGDSYEYGDLVIYDGSFYRCLVANSDVTFNPTKYQAIGSADGNFGIAEDVESLPSGFSSTDLKLYFVVEEGLFFLWDGAEWKAQQVIDTTLDADSNNAIANSAVASAMSALVSGLSYTDTPIDGNYVKAVNQENGVISVVREAFDSTPITGSLKGVTSDGIKKAVDAAKSTYEVSSEHLIINYSH